MSSKQTEAPIVLAPAFVALARRLGFTDEQMRLRCYCREQYDAFVATFRGSILYSAERDPSFYRGPLR